MEENDALFIKGFNNGYLLARHEPELMNKLMKEKNVNSEYFEGLASGKKEFAREKMQDQLKQQSRSHEKDQERER